MSLKKIPAHVLRKIAASAFGATVLSAACLLTVTRADADIHYTQSLTTAPAARTASLPGTAAGNPVVRLSTYSKGRRRRQDTSISMGSFKEKTIVLTLCDTGQIVRMDPALKIYTTTAISASPVEPFGLPSLPRPRRGGMAADMETPDGVPSAGGSPFPMPGAAAPANQASPGIVGDDQGSASPMIAGDPPAGAGMEPDAPQAVTPFPAQGAQTPSDAGPAQTTGKVVLTYAVQDMGTETVHAMTTHGYSVTVRRQASGCAGTGDTTTKMQIWFAPVKTGPVCPELSAPQRTITTARGCKITTVLQGDLDALTQLADQLPVRVKFFGKDGMEQGTMEMLDDDQASLDDGLFALPSDYRQVAASEFTRSQNQAMSQGSVGGLIPLMPAPSSNPGGAYPAPSMPGGPDAGGGAFPAPTGGGDAGTVNQSGEYPSPTQPAPGGTP